jgi:putative peptidoglycan lipid II flippase
MADGRAVPETESTSRHESRRIVRAVGVLASSTLLSRVLGLLRDVLTAAYFGAGGAMDAFFVAFRLPNMLRRLFAEGSLTVAFVPVFVDVLESEGEERAHELGRRAFTLLAVILTVVTAAGVLGAPLLVRLTAWGFLQEPAKFALTVDLTRWVFPFIGFVGLTALAGGMLNARGVFAYPALAPVVLNVAMITAVVALSTRTNPPIRSLAYGVLAGGMMQLLLQVPPLGRTGFRFRAEFRWKDPAIRRILALMGPTVFGVAVYQLNLLIATFLASWLPDGSVSYLYYADRLFELPLGIFAVSLGTASLPSLSRLAARRDEAAFRQTLVDALRMMAFVVLPATAGLLVLARPILGVLLQRGAFDAAMVDATAQALVCYALALLPVAGVRVVAPAFYALQDTRTPVKAAFWSLGVDLAASLILMVPLKHAGLALATAVSSAFNLAYLLRHLSRKVGNLPVSEARVSATKMLGATAGMAAAVALGSWWAPWERGGLAAGASLFILVAGGGAAYLILARLLGLADASRLGRMLGRRLGLA